MLEESCVSLNGVRVLVVDDEPDARMLVRRVLESCEAIVTTVESAPEAFEQIRTNPPDVLISDIGMPIEDGYSLIRRIRELESKTGKSSPALAPPPTPAPKTAPVRSSLVLTCTSLSRSSLRS